MDMALSLRYLRIDAMRPASDLSLPSFSRVKVGKERASTRERIKITRISSKRVNPLLHIPVFNVPILAFASLFAIRSQAYDIKVSMESGRHEDIGIPPRVCGNLLLLQVAAFPVFRWYSSRSRFLNEGFKTLLSFRIEAIVKLKELQRHLEVLNLQLGICDAGIVRASNDSRRHQGDSYAQDKNHNNYFKKGETSLVITRTFHTFFS